jgi:hypothetical protein
MYVIVDEKTRAGGDNLFHPSRGEETRSFLRVPGRDITPAS